jgi:UDP-N-acetyl-2-amino-2-deoxyglucuronate dehydrogenase
MKSLRVGIIGCGVIGPTHAACYRPLPGVELAWACDLQESRARKLAADYQIPNVTTDVRRVLRDPGVDAVSICTDHASHVALVIAALKAGKHVLCEKALAHQTTGLNAMLRAATAHPQLVCAGVFQHRFETLNRRVRDLIAAGTLGRMLTANVRLRCLRTNDYYRGDAWRGTWAMEGGSVLINQAIHYVDLLRWMMGGVRCVTGLHANLTHQDVIETEDTAVAGVEFTNGALGTIDATCSSHARWESALSFQGTAGSIELFDDAVARVALPEKAAGERLLAELRACQGASVEGPGKAYYGAGHPAQIADFVQAIREQRPPFVTAASAAETVDLVLGIYRSHRTGRRVALAPRTGPGQPKNKS